jgi:transposase-like protein
LCSFLLIFDFQNQSMFSTTPFNSIFDLIAAFPDEQSCIDHLEKLRWNDTIVSPFNPDSTVYKCSANRYRCKESGKYFNVRQGTIFEGTKISLKNWFMAIYLFTCHKKGISSHQLARDLTITQKTAWFMLQRIRYAMEHETFLTYMEGTIEADETFVGGKNKNRHKDKKVPHSQGRAFIDKTPVLGLLEKEVAETIERPHKLNPDKIVKEKIVSKESHLRCFVVSDTKASSIQPIIKQNVKAGSTIYSDEWWAYNGLNGVYKHSIVDHAKGQYVNDSGTTTNTLEGAWGQFKRTIIGTYHVVSRKHLQKYSDEFVFRYNLRKASADTRFNLFLQGTNGKRLTYKNLIS